MSNRYRDIARAETTDGIEYITNPIYPDIPLSENDFYIISAEGDRYDTLAQQFYSDHTLWWIIASTNNSERGSLVVEPGVQLRIPTDKDKIVQAYNQFNQKR